MQRDLEKEKLLRFWLICDSSILFGFNLLFHFKKDVIITFIWWIEQIVPALVQTPRDMGRDATRRIG